jgi:acetyltransferase-like isoleucine patch superfamily enzyme
MLIKIEKYRDLRVEENVDLTIGRSCSFNGMVIHNDGKEKCKSRPKVTIGRHFHSGKRCVIRTSDHDFTRGYPMVVIAGYKVADVRIGDFVWFGDDVLVMKGVTIGDGVVVQARSVVVSDLPDLAIAGGHPCRQFASRDPDDYAFFKGLDMALRDKKDPEGQLARLEAALAERAKR